MFKVGDKVVVDVSYIENNSTELDFQAVEKFLASVKEPYLLITDIDDKTPNPYILDDFMGFAENEIELYKG